MIQSVDKTFYVREATLTDLPLYAQLLRNDDWLTNTGFRADEFASDAQIGRFIQKENPGDVRWVCYHGGKGFVAFIHFNVVSDDCAITIGGILPHLLNSGWGIKYYAWCTDLFFKFGNRRVLRSNVLQANIRSCKMNLALGYELVSLKTLGSLKFDVYETDRERFYNAPLVMRILKQNSP